MVIIWISAVFLFRPSLVDVGVSAFVAVAVIVIGNNDDEIRKNAVDVISKKKNWGILLFHQSFIFHELKY